MLKPTFNRLVVRPFKVKDKTEGGILLPDSAKAKPSKGTVVAVGPCKNSGSSPKVGDTVIYSQHAGIELEDSNGEKVLVMQYDEILCSEENKKDK